MMEVVEYVWRQCACEDLGFQTRMWDSGSIYVSRDSRFGLVIFVQTVPSAKLICESTSTCKPRQDPHKETNRSNLNSFQTPTKQTCQTKVGDSSADSSAHSITLSQAANKPTDKADSWEASLVLSEKQPKDSEIL